VATQKDLEQEARHWKTSRGGLSKKNLLGLPNKSWHLSIHGIVIVIISKLFCQYV